jgi:hypothetical protein
MYIYIYICIYIYVYIQWLFLFLYLMMLYQQLRLYRIPRVNRPELIIECVHNEKSMISQIFKNRKYFRC